MKIRLLIFVFILLASAAAYAGPIQMPAPVTTPAPVNVASDGYVPPSLENIAKLYWVTGKFDINDNAAVDGYLAINECYIFQKYYHNDLEWNTIRDAARQKIARDIATFPTLFEIVIPIKLGRYDNEKRQFEVTPDTVLNAARKFDVAYNPNSAICGLNYELKGYPRNIVLLLNRPFDFKTVPVEPELANSFINDTQKQLDNTPLKYHVVNYERTSYLRMKVHIVQYKNEMLVTNGNLRALMFGRLDGFEVYADQERKQLLYKQDIQDDKLFRHVRDNPVAAAPAPVATPPPAVPPPIAPASAPPAAANKAATIPAYQPPGGEGGIENDTNPSAGSNRHSLGN